jgi:hypothetical protein
MADAIRDVRIQVTRVEQKRSYYCGAACSQMVLGLYQIPCDQSDAFTKIQHDDTEPTAFYSDPDGISGFLNSSASGKIGFQVTFFSTTTFHDILSRIYYKLNFLQFPCISLVQGGGHWVVFDGIRVSQDPTGKTNFLGVYVENPWYNEVPSTYVTSTELQESLIIPDTFGTKWKGKLVILSDPSTGPLLETPAVTTRPPAGGSGDSSPIGSALTGLQLQGFDNIRPIAVGGGAPLLQTIEVTGLDGASDYFLAPLDAVQNKEFGDFIYAAVKKDTGELLSVSTLSNALQIYTDDEMRRDLDLKFPGHAVVIEPGFFWKSCFELRSRFNVARKFKLDGREMFLLPDGSTVDALHDFPKGGH